MNNKLSQMDSHTNSLFLEFFETCENVTLFSISKSSASILNVSANVKIFKNIQTSRNYLLKKKCYLTAYAYLVDITVL